MTTDHGLHLDPLTACARDTERHVAAAGWDQPPRLFALVRTSSLLASQPQLADKLRDEDPDGLTAIEQEISPDTKIEPLLAQMMWPPEVDGAAIVVERIVVPPDAEREAPEDAAAATAYYAAHPDRKDVRLLAAVERDGGRVCLLRQRAHDHDDQVALGTDIAPGLVDALAGTLMEAP